MWFSTTAAVGLLALSSTVAAISQTDFDILKNVAAVGYTYSMGQNNQPACTLPRIKDFSGKIWNYLDAVNITDGAGGPITVRLFRRDDTGNTDYYVFFPGTSDGRNWATNVQTDLVPYPYCTGCTVHKGFYEAWTNGRQAVTDMVKRAKDKNPATANYNVVVGGGSLGGALSIFAYADWKTTKPYGINPSRGLSFGQPRVGNYNFAQFVNGYTNASPSSAGSWQRVTHGWDTVPRALPPTSYYHPGTEINMMDSLANNNRPTASSSTLWLNVSPNNENQNGNNSPSPAGPAGNPGDHVTYPGYGSESAPCVAP